MSHMRHEFVLYEIIGSRNALLSCEGCCRVTLAMEFAFPVQGKTAGLFSG